MMRWPYVEKEDNGPRIGDQRIVRRFLLFPRRLPAYGSGKVETRWLERAYIIQEYANNYLPTLEMTVKGWDDLSWAGDEGQYGPHKYPFYSRIK